MRTEPMPEGGQEDEGVALADVVDHMGTVLHRIDEQLAEFGLEVVMLDDESATYWWRIAKRT